MLRILALGWLVLLPFAVFAQETETDDNEPIGATYWMIGYSGNRGDFNFRLPALSMAPIPYPELETLVNNFSLLIGNRTDRFDGHFSFYGGQNEVSRGANGNTSRYRQGGIGLSFAFNLIGENPGKWFLGPEVVTNFQFAQVVLADRTDVNTILDIPLVEYYKVNQFSIPVDLGLQFGKRFTNPKNQRFWIFSLRGGYRLASDDDWQLDAALPIDIFPVSTQGFYFGLSIGRGGLSDD